MLTKLLRDFVRKITLPVGRGLARLGLTANHMTVMGGLVSLVAAYIVATGSPFVGGLVLIGGSLFDVLDGAIARAQNVGTVRGAFLDSTLDRLSDGAIFAAIAFRLADEPVAMAVALGCLVLGLLTSYIRARAEGLGMSCDVGIAERSERTILVAAGLLFGIIEAALAVLLFASAVTVVQRFAHVMKQARGRSI